MLIIFVIIIIFRITAVALLFFALGTLSQRAAAQAAPPVTFQAPGPVAVPPTGLSKPPSTKLLRIYRGPGHFDDALAVKLLPTLAKAFPSARSAPAPAASEAVVTARTKVANQKKVATAH